jgi:hypothetical protein
LPDLNLELQESHLTSEATVSTTKPAAYMRQLCKHFGHRVPTAYDDSTGRITFEFGSCELVAGSDQLTLLASATEPTELNRLKQVVGSHLERFGRRDELEVSWSEQAST